MANASKFTQKSPCTTDGQPLKLQRTLFHLGLGDNFDEGYFQAASEIQEIEDGHTHACNAVNFFFSM